MNIFKTTYSGIRIQKKLNRCIKNVILIFQMKCKFYSIFFPQVLYKFTGSILRALTGETWLRRSDLKRAQFLYREKENKKTPLRPARFICRVNGKPRGVIMFVASPPEHMCGCNDQIDISYDQYRMHLKYSHNATIKMKSEHRKSFHSI